MHCINLYAHSVKLYFLHNSAISVQLYTKLLKIMKFLNLFMIYIFVFGMSSVDCQFRQC